MPANALQQQSLARAPLSAFVICYNEERNLRDCLESLRFCDEIVVVDSFSTDRTVEIAREFTERVYQRAWTNYRDQKAYALELTSHEWVLNLDSDERVTPDLRESIIQALSLPEGSPQPSGYMIHRLVFHLGKWWRRGGWYPEYRLRLFRKSEVEWKAGEVHEKVIPKGKVQRLQGDLLHYSFRDLNDQISKLQRLAAAAAEEAFRKGKKASLIKLIVNPLWRFFKFYLVKGGYREGTAGLIVAVLEGYYTFLKYARLWEYHHGSR